METMLKLLHHWGLGPDYSVHGAEMDALTSWVHILMALLFVGWGIFFAFTLFKFRASKNPKANYNGVQSHVSHYIEYAVVVAEIALLLLFSIPLWGARLSSMPPESESTVVRVVAEQFQWNMHYAGKDGIFGKTAPELVNSDNNPVGIDWDNDENAADDFVSTNELVAPLGKPIIVKLSSKDVIHSFGAQFFRVRQDAIPGMNATLWFTPTTLSVDMADQLAKDLPTYVNDLQASSPPVNWLAAKDYPGYVNEGERLTNEILDRMYNNNKETVFAKPRTPAEIACSQLCGLGHFRMRGVINIVTQKEYDAWVKEQAPTE